MMKKIKKQKPFKKVKKGADTFHKLERITAADNGN